MYVPIVLIDFLTPEGILTSYKVEPRHHPLDVVVDRLRDIYRELFSDDDVDLGGTRIYNASNCFVEKQSARIRAFKLYEGECRFSFQFGHMGVPIRSRDGGIYNFVLPPGWRLREIRVVDAYDEKEESLQRKNQFEYKVFWDTECQTSLVDMELRAGRGSFSFIVAGTASLTAVDPEGVAYAEAVETRHGVAQLQEINLLDDEGHHRLADELAEKADWLVLKPNVFGVGINVNEIIRDCIGYFQRKVRRK